MGKIEAKNGLENYCFQMRNTLNDEKQTIEATSNEGLQWIDGNAEAEAEAFEAKQKELEAKFNPIMMRIYQAAGGAPQGGMGGMPGDAGAANAPAPDATMEDLD